MFFGSDPRLSCSPIAIGKYRASVAEFPPLTHNYEATHISIDEVICIFDPIDRRGCVVVQSVGRDGVLSCGFVHNNRNDFPFDEKLSRVLSHEVRRVDGLVVKTRWPNVGPRDLRSFASGKTALVPGLLITLCIPLSGVF